MSIQDRTKGRCNYCVFIRPEGCSELGIGQVFFHLDTVRKMLVASLRPTHDKNHERGIEGTTKVLCTLVGEIPHLCDVLTSLLILIR